MNYEKDKKLAEQGRLNIEWAEQQMGALLGIKKRSEREKPLKVVNKDRNGTSHNKGDCCTGQNSDCRRCND